MLFDPKNLSNALDQMQNEEDQQEQKREGPQIREIRRGGGGGAGSLIWKKTVPDRSGRRARNGSLFESGREGGGR